MDWKRIIAELSEAGLTQAQIGAYVRHPQSWVSYVANAPDNFDVRWEDGERLRKLHARVMRQKRKAANG